MLASLVFISVDMSDLYGVSAGDLSSLIVGRSSASPAAAASSLLVDGGGETARASLPSKVRAVTMSFGSRRQRRRLNTDSFGYGLPEFHREQIPRVWSD